MDLKNVETFVKVAELQSFTKAAEELSYVQSTVTMQIKQLEKENPGFKTRLFTAIEGSHAGNFGIFPK